MRILITGASGMLGCHLSQALRHHDLTLASHKMLDITDKNAVNDAIAAHDVVVNAAAYTNVDRAESEAPAARKVNTIGVEHLAHASAKFHTRLIQISTDYVFDGTSREPYSEISNHNPQTIYGQTKADAEAAVAKICLESSVIVRTAWLYGKYGKNFPATILSLAESRDLISVVDDQTGQPTWTWDLAQDIKLVLESEVAGEILHGTNSGEATWFEFAQAVFEESGLDPERIVPVSSADMPRPAPRPAYSVLGHSRWNELGLPEPRHWREALHDASKDGFSLPLP